MSKRPTVLIILDGWGYREESTHNAIAKANTPEWDRLWSTYPHTLTSGSGLDVGLPNRQMGNSEVGHINLGAGRVVYQNLVRVDRAIESGEFFKNAEFNQAIDQLLVTGHALHIMGLVSGGGVHSHLAHIIAAIQLAARRGVKSIYVHAFLDGRDTAPQSAKDYLAELEQAIADVPQASIVSLSGRYYAMDRDNRWERVEKAYHALTEAQAEFIASTPEAGIEMAYQRGETDEFVQPTLVTADKVSAPQIVDGDAVFFMNFRADRARQLTQAFVLDDFAGFARKKIALGDFVTLTEYQAGLPVQVAYKPEKLANVLGEYLSTLGLKQLRIAETEKYAHVTFFFNGGVEEPFVGEDRQLIPSPKVATYDLQPEMSAPEVTKALTTAAESEQYDAIICNYANADMVGHTGNEAAAIQAIEAIDHALKDVVESVQRVGGQLLITADHGNAEQMVNPNTGAPHTAHTNLPVPLLYIGSPAKVVVDDSTLSDIAPTMLQLMGLAIPSEMTGRPIFKVEE